MLGTRLAHYEITSHLGSGGMGDVYQAADTKLGRSIAMKLLVARFEREARALAARIKRGPIPVDESLTIAKQICEALSRRMREESSTQITS
jgi:serine/threonine protein kinase